MKTIQSSISLLVVATLANIPMGMAQAEDSASRRRGGETFRQVDQLTTREGNYIIKYSKVDPNSPDIILDQAEISRTGQNARTVVRAEIQTEGCGECATQTHYFTSTREDLVGSVVDLGSRIRTIVGQIEQPKEETEVATESRSRGRTNGDLSGSASGDAEYDRLSCVESEDDYERAMCLAENLEDIKEKGRRDRKYDTLLSRARRFIAREAVRSYDVEDPRDLHEARSRFRDLHDVIEDSDDRQLLSKFRSLESNLERASRERVQVSHMVDRFNDNLSPRLDYALEQLDYARQSGDSWYEYRAQSQVTALMAEGQQYLRTMRGLSPSNEIALMSRGGEIPASSFDFFERYFEMSEQTLETTMLEYKNLSNGTLAPLGGDQLRRYDDIRQSRNGGFSLLNTGMPAWGSQASIYDNLLLSERDQNFSASDFMSQNPNMSQPRGRGTSSFQ